jgi:hypothetical protein
MKRRQHLTNDEWQREHMRHRLEEADPVYAEQVRIARSIAHEDAKEAARLEAEIIAKRRIDRRLRELAEAPATRTTAKPTDHPKMAAMTERWLCQNVTHASLDAVEADWRRKLVQLKLQGQQLGSPRSDLSRKLGGRDAVRARLAANKQLKKKINRALHHVEWLRWVIDGFSFAEADTEYDLADDYDKELLHEVIRRASGVRPLPYTNAEIEIPDRDPLDE